MKNPRLALIIPLALFLTSCAMMQPAYNSNRSNSSASTDPGCFAHGSLDYQVKVCYWRVTYGYSTIGSESDARTYDENAITDALQSSANNNRGYGYEITTDDNAANLNLSIKIYTDNSDNYTWHIDVYGLGHTLPDGTSGLLFSLNSDHNYRNSGDSLDEQMFKDMASKLNTFVSEGWHCN